MSRINSSTLKALDVLEMLAAAEDGLRLTDVKEGTGYPLTTVRRLLVSLIERGYVEQDPMTSRYYPGTKILTLQAHGIRHRHIGRRAFPRLSRLQQELDETVNLGIMSDNSVIYLETLVPSSSFSFYAPPGTRMPLHCTAMGKVFLAHLTASARASVLEALDFKPFTPHTVTGARELESLLQEIALRGFAVDNEEYALGVRCLAAPIRDHRGAIVAGVSVTASASRLSPDRDQTVAVELTRACGDISQGLGFPAPLPESVAV